MCWGTSTTDSSTGLSVANFEVPFKNNDYGIVGIAQPASSGSGTARFCTYNASTRTPSQVTFTVLSSNGSFAGTWVTWTAIGRWK